MTQQQQKLGKEFNQEILSIPISKVFAWGKRPTASPTYTNYLSYTGIKEAFSAIKKKLPEISEKDSAYIGIEIEIEGIESTTHIPPGWKAIKDGSLREDGIEFLSIALRQKQIQDSLAAIYSYLRKLSGKNPEFSWRTSIHIHLDARDYIQQEFCSLLLLYCIFEEALFKFCGEHRAKSIFCVPVTQSWLGRNIYFFLHGITGFADLVGVWEKYSALNLSRLGGGGPGSPGLGTIEFRHMPGTWDFVKVMNWIKMILALDKAAVSISYPEVLDLVQKMNTLSNYNEVKKLVFGDELGELLRCKDFNFMLSRGVRFTKDCLSYTDVRKLQKVEDSGIISYQKKIQAKIGKEKKIVKKKEFLELNSEQFLASSLQQATIQWQTATGQPIQQTIQAPFIQQFINDEEAP